jgi:hypothetical protein
MGINHAALGCEAGKPCKVDSAFHVFVLDEEVESSYVRRDSDPGLDQRIYSGG